MSARVLKGTKHELAAALARISGAVREAIVFDPKGYRDTATYEKPHRYAAGVKHALVNGKVVIDGAESQEVLAGGPLPHRGE